MAFKKNINILFITFLTTHLILWTLIPSLSNKNLPLDTIEALAWASNFEFGFDKHPPMSAAAVWLFYDFFGNQDWSYYLLSQIFLIISFIFVWKLSYEFFKDKSFALISVLLLEGIVFYNYTSPEFNVYICQLPFRILTIFYFWHALKDDNLLSWILLGIFAAFGFLSHYLFSYLLVSMLLIFLLLRQKKEMFSFKIISSLTIFLLILTPHFFWLFENDFITIKYASYRSGLSDSAYINHIINPIIFILKQVVMLLPFFVLCLCLITKKKIKFNLKLKDKKLIFLIGVSLLPIFFIFITSFVTGARIRTMWLSPFYLSFGILFLYIFKTSINLRKYKKFFLTFVVIFLLSPSTYLYISLSQTDKRTDFPGEEISDLVQKRWDRNFSNEIKVVVGDEWSAGNLSYHLYSRPKWFRDVGKSLKKIKPEDGFIYTGDPEILKDICPGIYGTIKPYGYCMIGLR